MQARKKKTASGTRRTRLLAKQWFVLKEVKNYLPENEGALVMRKAYFNVPPPACRLSALYYLFHFAKAHASRPANSSLHIMHALLSCRFLLRGRTSLQRFSSTLSQGFEDEDLGSSQARLAWAGGSYSSGPLH